MAGNNFVENELKRIMKSKHDRERDRDGDASTHAGVSKSQSRKTSDTEIQTSKKKPSKRVNEEEKEKNEKSSNYEDILVKMADEVNLEKDKLLGFLDVKKRPEDFENGIIITSGVNKILRYFDIKIIYIMEIGRCSGSSGKA